MRYIYIYIYIYSYWEISFVVWMVLGQKEGMFTVDDALFCSACQ